MTNKQEQLLPLAAQQTMKDIFNIVPPSEIMYHIALIQNEVIKANKGTGINNDIADACQTLAFIAEFIQIIQEEKEE